MMELDENSIIKLMPISDQEFDSIRKLIYDRFGINLTEQKRSLVVGRLQKLIQNLNLQSFSEYMKYLQEDRTERALVELVNRITTNHTFFYRESDHFDFFCKTVLPELIKARRDSKRELRIWSAGCSSGEEPYMLVMLMMETLGLEYSSWDAGVLATDVSDRVISLAKEAIYPEDRVSLVPAHLKNKYFKKLPDGNYQVNENVRKEVTFRHFNLMNERFPFKRPFDVIFCRNVMIYFDAPTRDALITKFHDSTAQNGYLFIGHSESLKRDSGEYKYVGPAIYRKAGPG